MDKIIQQLISKVKRDSLVLAVGFFGSSARGEPSRDIDVCIFLRPEEYSAEELARKRFQYTPEEQRYDVQIFQQLPLYIRQRILKEGKILYCKNKDLLYDLAFMTAREFTHFRHIYEGYLEAVAHG